MEEIAFIINSFNRLKLLQDALKVLSKWLPSSSFSKRCAIVVYDAGSTDGTLEWLHGDAQLLGLKIKVVKPEKGEDTSFAAGLNKGVTYAHSIFPSLKYLLFYETDNQFFSEVPILQALKVLEMNKKLAACGFTVKKHSQADAGVGMPFPSILNFILGKNIVFKFQLERIPYKWLNPTEDILFSKLDVVYTSPLVVKMEAWKESGGLDAQLFPFSDCDVDWAKRLSDLGWNMGVIKTKEVIHDNCEELSAWSKNRAIDSHRGRLRYFKKHHPKKLYLAWPFLLSFRHIFEYIVVLTMIKDKSRRKRLSPIYGNLIKLCFSRYNT